MDAHDSSEVLVFQLIGSLATLAIAGGSTLIGYWQGAEFYD
jgi:hypothetical protein